MRLAVGLNKLIKRGAYFELVANNSNRARHVTGQLQVSRYDCGVNAMSMAQVEACAPVAANWLAAQVHGMTTEQTAELILSALK